MAKPCVPLLLLTTVVLTPLSNSYVSTRDSGVKYSLFSIGSWISCCIYSDASVEKTIGNDVCSKQLVQFVVSAKCFLYRSTFFDYVLIDYTMAAVLQNDAMDAVLQDDTMDSVLGGYNECCVNGCTCSCYQIKMASVL